MKPKISISVNKSSVVEGDVVEVAWSCEGADSVQLTLDNGYKCNSVPVEFSGSKKFRLNRSKGKTHIVIETKVGTKSYFESVRVRVKKLKVTKTQDVYEGSRPSSGLKAKWNNFTAKLKMAWGYMPENKRLAYKILAALCLLSLLSFISPRFLSLGLLVVVGYLCYVILKK